MKVEIKSLKNDKLLEILEIETLEELKKELPKWDFLHHNWLDSENDYILKFKTSGICELYLYNTYNE